MFYVKEKLNDTMEVSIEIQMRMYFVIALCVALRCQ